MSETKYAAIRSAVRAAVALAASAASGDVLFAQSTLPRDFERVHFARQEAELDRRFTGAGTRVRDLSMRALREAFKMRGWADSLATTRAERLAAAWTKLAGVPATDEAVADRFDWYLLALPEIVDTKKLDGDRVRLGEITRSIYPLLRPVRVTDPAAPAKDRNAIFLTGRTAFGFRKPPGLRLRMQIEAAGRIVQKKERGDSDDPKGWMLYDLASKFELSEQAAAGQRNARMLVGRNASWPRVGDPTNAVTFWHAPGYHKRAWKLFDKSMGLVGKRRIVDLAAESADWARLSVLQDEVLRPLLGRDYIHRSWPVRALDEALLLVERLAAQAEKTAKNSAKTPSKTPAKDAAKGTAKDSAEQRGAATPEAELVEPIPDAGDRSYGIVAGKAELRRVLPLRVLWGPRSKSIKKRVLFVIAPGGHDENWVLDGLRVSRSKIMSTPGLIVAFAHDPLEIGYFEGASALLQKLFDVDTRNITLAGFLDGGLRARFAFPRFGGPLAEIALVGKEVPDVALVRENKRVARLRVISAYGHPSKMQVDRLLQLPSYKAEKARLRFRTIGDRPRSFAEAFELLLADVMRAR